MKDKKQLIYTSIFIAFSVLAITNMAVFVFNHTLAIINFLIVCIIFGAGFVFIKYFYEYIFNISTKTKKFIEEYLIPRANKGEILLIFRGNKDNNIDLSKADMSKIVVVEPKSVQSFTFSCEKNVGSKIIEYIKKNKLMW